MLDWTGEVTILPTRPRKKKRKKGKKNLPILYESLTIPKEKRKKKI